MPPIMLHVSAATTPAQYSKYTRRINSAGPVLKGGAARSPARVIGSAGTAHAAYAGLMANSPGVALTAGSPTRAAGSASTAHAGSSALSPGTAHTTGSPVRAVGSACSAYPAQAGSCAHSPGTAHTTGSPARAAGSRSPWLAPKIVLQRDHRQMELRGKSDGDDHLDSRSPGQHQKIVFLQRDHRQMELRGESDSDDHLDSRSPGQHQKIVLQRDHRQMELGGESDGDDQLDSAFSNPLQHHEASHAEVATIHQTTPTKSAGPGRGRPRPSAPPLRTAPRALSGRSGRALSSDGSSASGSSPAHSHQQQMLADLSRGLLREADATAEAVRAAHKAKMAHDLEVLTQRRLSLHRGPGGFVTTGEGGGGTSSPPPPTRNHVGFRSPSPTAAKGRSTLASKTPSGGVGGGCGGGGGGGGGAHVASPAQVHEPSLEGQSAYPGLGSPMGGRARTPLQQGEHADDWGLSGWEAPSSSAQLATGIGVPPTAPMSLRSKSLMRQASYKGSSSNNSRELGGCDSPSAGRRAPGVAL
eukprot:gene22711-29872_t